MPIFHTPLSFGSPRSQCSLWTFVLNLTMRKLESWGYPLVGPHDPSLSRFGMILACDRRSDGQTDRVYHS